MIEALEDFEARFFAPHAQHRHLLDRFQAKSGTLTRSDLIEVFDSFLAFETAHPQTARVQTLVTPALPATLIWLARDPGRVRRARPFYSPFSGIRAASDEKLRGDLINEFGDDLGNFFANSIEVDIRASASRANAEASFAAAMHEAFPELDVGARTMASAFTALTDLVARSRGVMLERSQVLNVLDSVLGLSLILDRRLHIHIRSDRNGPGTDAIEIDAKSFAGTDASFPPPARWRLDLLEPLESTARWARERNHQRILLSGSYRLSTAFAFGWSFRSAIGFEIDIDTRSGFWATDEHPSPDMLPLPWRISSSHRLVDNQLVVAAGVLRDPSVDVKNFLGLSEENDLLTATFPRALVNGTEAQAFVQAIKAAVSQAVSELKPTAISLFLAGPAALAVTLGHRWNTFPPTQIHEFIANERRYVPTIMVG